ncbi:MAG: cation:proton antiporter [Proteobacteria bacterium]|nr:cation:proton antiporter [Pseudomonadota bacterium]
MLLSKAMLLSLIIFSGILCQWFAWRVKLPAILFLLITGIVAGPVMGILDSDLLFGELLFPFISLSVAVILFEGSLTLEYRQIAGLQKVVRRMISFGVIVTWLITATATRLVFHFPWGLSLLFGAITVVTGPTVIVPMIRTVRPTMAIANILRWEGIVIDPIGATLAVLVYEFIVSAGSGSPIGHTLLTFGRIIGIGLFFGAATGYLFGLVLRQHFLPEFLHSAGTLAIVFFIFSLSNYYQEESGLLTVTVMGMWLANMKDVPREKILHFKENLSVLLISVLFIVLAARLDLHRLISLGMPVFIIFITIQFLSRPLSVVVSSLGSSLTWSERHLLAWIAPRGIVAAAISALFAIKLKGAGYAEADLLVPLTFMVIIGTVVLQSSTARLIAKLLGVAEPYPKGFLIIGANAFAVAVAKALEQNDFKALLVDTSWEKIGKARMAGLDAFHGEAVSQPTEQNLNLIGMGTMLALTPRGSLNSLACMHYRMELGPNSVYAIRTTTKDELVKRGKVLRNPHWKNIFNNTHTFDDLEDIINQGGMIRSTALTDTFSYDHYKVQYNQKAIPLFAINPKGKIYISTEENTLTPKSQWTIISLIPMGSEAVPTETNP